MDYLFLNFISLSFAFIFFRMESITQFSKAVYIGLSDEIGTASEVRFRRDTLDTSLDISNCLFHKLKGDILIAGSYREGFRFSSSDMDFMAWSFFMKVISDLSQISSIPFQQKRVFLMEYDSVPPGYTKLRSFTFTPNQTLQIDDSFISCSVFRKSLVTLLNPGFKDLGTEVSEHGPCSFAIHSGFELDVAGCMKCDYWPETAKPWIRRCNEKGWPSDIVVNQIVKSGCHVVPIGSCPENELEWRISFSVAEQKIIYSFNHSQFLCYGLLKLFLKEVINVNNKTPVLCSYFLKTAMFWVIQNDRAIRWTPENFMYCFWNSFKLLIHWVYTGYCPSFFIPENNLFRKKVTGHTQSFLFHQLYCLYNEGMHCILKCPTIQPKFNVAILNESLLRTSEETDITTSCLELRSIHNLSHSIKEKGTISELEAKDPTSCLKNFILLLNQIDLSLKKDLNPYQALTIQTIASPIFHNIAMSIQDRVDHSFFNNRDTYKSMKTALSLLKLSCIIGSVSEILYLAMYYYRNCRYQRSMMCLNKAMIRMCAPYSFFFSTNIHHYIRALGGLSLSSKYKRAIIRGIVLRYECSYISELVLEQKTDINMGILYCEGELKISPLVMLLMLLILNYHKLDDSTKSDYYIQSLKTLLFSDDEEYISHFPKDLSWQILGICQQTCGYHGESLDSFLRSLKEKPSHRIRPATYLRMLLSIFLLKNK